MEGAFWALGLTMLSLFAGAMVFSEKSALKKHIYRLCSLCRWDRKQGGRLPVFLVSGLFVVGVLAGCKGGQWPRIPQAEWESVQGTEGHMEGWGRVRRCSFNEEKAEAQILLDRVRITGYKDYIPGMGGYISQDPGVETGKSLNLVFSGLSDDKAFFKHWHPGQILSFKGIFSQYDMATNPGAFDYRSYQFSLGIMGQVEARESDMSIMKEGSRLFTFLQNIRNWLISRIRLLAESEDAGILTCILTGDKSGLDKAWKKLYQEGGILHLLTISGLHISILGMGTYRFMRKTLGDFILCSFGSGLVVVGFCLVSGGGSSVTRASMCFLLYVLGDLMGRQFDMASANSLAGILILMEHPLLLFQSGFLMTYSCVLGISFLLPLADWMFTRPEEWKPFVKAVLMQMSSLAILLWFQGKLPLLGALINLVTVPFMSYVLVSDILAILVSMLDLGLGRAFLGPAHYILAWYSGVCKGASLIPGSMPVLGRPRPVQLALWFLLILLVFGVFYYRACYKKQTSNYVWVLVLLPISLLLLQRWPYDSFHVTFLDVGQGDGIVMEFPGGREVFCIDGGSSSNTKLGEYVYDPFFSYAGIGEVDYWLVTHPDLDHYSGLVDRLESGTRVRHILLPEIFKDSDLKKKLEAYAPVTLIKAGMVWRYKEIALEVLHPSEGYYPDSENDGSAVILVSVGKHRLLLTGDLEEAGEDKVLAAMRGRKADILKLGHHGSKYSSSQAFLEGICPEHVVISVGRKNSYGHPAKETLQRVTKLGCRIWRTDRMGAITLDIKCIKKSAGWMVGSFLHPMKTG